MFFIIGTCLEFAIALPFSTRFVDSYDMENVTVNLSNSSTTSNKGLKSKKSNFVTTVASTSLLTKTPQDDGVDFIAATAVVFAVIAAFFLLVCTLLKILKSLSTLSTLSKKNRAAEESPPAEAPPSNGDPVSEEDAVEVRYDFSSHHQNLETISGLVSAYVTKNLMHDTTMDLRTPASYKKSFSNFQKEIGKSQQDKLPTYNETINEGDEPTTSGNDDISLPLYDEVSGESFTTRL